MQGTSQTPWYKERWPWLLAIMPITSIIVGVAFLWAAIKSNDGLVTDDYYKQGLAINKIIKRDEAAKRYGVTAMVQFRNSIIELKLGGHPKVIPDSLKLTLAHPTREGYDHAILLRRAASGFYEGKIQSLFNARYDVILEPLNGDWRLAGKWRPDDGETLNLNSST
jgi:hypothetical protein